MATENTLKQKQKTNAQCSLVMFRHYLKYRVIWIGKNYLASEFFKLS